MKFEPGNLVQIEASRCHANGRVNTRTSISSSQGIRFFPGKPLPMNERYYAARFRDNYGNIHYVNVPCSTPGIYISEHVVCPDKELFPDYENLFLYKGRQRIVNKVLFPEIGKFLYIENNFLKRMIK